MITVQPFVTMRGCIAIDSEDPANNTVLQCDDCSGALCNQTSECVRVLIAGTPLRGDHGCKKRSLSIS